MYFSIELKFISRITGKEITDRAFFSECPNIALSEDEISEKIRQLERIVHIIFLERFRLLNGLGFSSYTLSVLHYDTASQRGSIELTEPDIRVFFVLRLPVITFVDLQGG